ncbi:MAG: hypothetical protein ACK55I_21935, partial [bacterium]
MATKLAGAAPPCPPLARVNTRTDVDDFLGAWGLKNAATGRRNDYFARRRLNLRLQPNAAPKPKTGNGPGTVCTAPISRRPLKVRGSPNTSVPITLPSIGLMSLLR